MIINKLSRSPESIDFPHLATMAAKTALSLPEKAKDGLHERRKKAPVIWTSRHIQAATGTLSTISAYTSASFKAIST